MRNIKLTLQYDGSRYKGWQRLSDTDMTIQSKLELVLSKMAEEKIEVTGSGRTDVGVHALGQIANFKTNSKMSTPAMLDYLYRYLPEDIVVVDASEVDDRFHARYNVVSKKYLYRIWNGKFHDPFLRKYSHYVPDNLDIEGMRISAAHLLGEHDFSAFRSSRSQKKSSVRTMYSINIEKKDEIIDIVFHGNGFLHNMARVMTGTLLEVGLKRMQPDNVREALLRGDRNLAGPTAPAKGLFLLEVEY
jgi:tRNA pseudouridine38-40 synthase